MNKSIKDLLEDSEKLDDVRLLLAKLQLKVYDLIYDKSAITMQELMKELEKIYEKSI